MFLVISCLLLLVSAARKTDRLQVDPGVRTMKLNAAYASGQYEAKQDGKTFQTFKARLCQPGDVKGLYLTVVFRNPQNPSWKGCEDASLHQRNRNLKGQTAEDLPARGGVLGFDVASNFNFTSNLHSSYTARCGVFGPTKGCSCLKSTLQFTEPFDPKKWGSDMVYIRTRSITSQMIYSFEVEFREKPISNLPKGLVTKDLGGNGSLFNNNYEFCNEAHNCQWLKMSFKADVCNGPCEVKTNDKIVFTTPMCLEAKHWRGNFEISAASGPSAFEIYMCSLAVVMNGSDGPDKCSRFSIQELSGRSVDWIPVSRVSGSAAFAEGGGFGISVRGVGGAPWTDNTNFFYITGFQSLDSLPPSHNN